MKLQLILCLALVLSGNGDAAIINPNAPEGGQTMVSENLSRDLQSDPRFFDGLKIHDLTIAAPHREYFVGLTNLVSGQLLSAAASRSWRYLLMHGTNALGAASLIAGGTNGNGLKFNALQRPFFPNATMEALRKAEALPQVKKRDFEIRTLVVPAVNFIALWLHAESDDIIIPLPPTFGRFGDYQICSESQIIEVLKKDAVNAMKQPNLLR